MGFNFPTLWYRKFAFLVNEILQKLHVPMSVSVQKLHWWKRFNSTNGHEMCITVLPYQLHGRREPKNLFLELVCLRPKRYTKSCLQDPIHPICVIAFSSYNCSLKVSLSITYADACFAQFSFFCLSGTRERANRRTFCCDIHFVFNSNVTITSFRTYPWVNRGAYRVVFFYSYYLDLFTWTLDQLGTQNIAK